MRDPQIPFTKEGYEKIQKEYDELHVTRKDAVIELARARDMGDRSENAAYKVARQRLSSIDSRIRHLGRLLRFGKIVEPPKTEEVGIGSTVVIDDGMSHKTYTIVGSYESDIPNGKLSCYSPIGKALMGKKLHEEIRVLAPAGQLRYRIISILYT